MHHGSKRLDGPVRGTTAWWRGLAPPPGADLSAAGPPIAPTQDGAGRDDTTDKDDGIRWELVRRVRDDIAAGTYDTPERWEAALDQLLDRLCHDL